MVRSLARDPQVDPLHWFVVLRGVVMGLGIIAALIDGNPVPLSAAALVFIGFAGVRWTRRRRARRVAAIRRAARR